MRMRVRAEAVEARKHLDQALASKGDPGDLALANSIARFVREAGVMERSEPAGREPIGVHCQRGRLLRQVDEMRHGGAGQGRDNVRRALY